jgi:hypothetical protein
LLLLVVHLKPTVLYNYRITDIVASTSEMPEYPLDSYQYEDLPTLTSFRVVELLPGKESDPVYCLQHIVDWSNPLEYEAISYAWGDPSARAPVTCHGKRLEVTQSLHRGLSHFRFQHRSRFLWADAIW